MQKVNRQGKTNVDLDPADYKPRDILRLSRLARELRLTNQILSRDLEEVTVTNKGHAPAWTTLDGTEVSFSMSHMPLPIRAIDVAIWLGTNAHELGHVLFSPRRQSLLMTRLIEADKLFLGGIMQLHNIAEDQREERLILSRFSPWRNYLIAALGFHITPGATGDAWVLLAGRTWLDESIRKRVRAEFVGKRGEPAAVEVADLIGDYQKLTDPGESESDQAWEILVRLHTLFDLGIPDGGCGGGILKEGGPITDPGPGNSIPTADEAEGNEAETDGSEGDSNNPDGKGKGEKDGEGDSPDQPGDDSLTGKGAGNQGEPPKQPKQPSISEALKDQARRGLAREPDSKADIQSILDALDYGRTGGDGVEGDPPEGRNQGVTDAARTLHRLVGDALLDLKDDSEPGWVKGVSSGRLNVRRLVNPRVDPETLFDRYEPGQMDASELELVLVLDVSGSMSSQCFALGEATWAIRQAVDDIEGNATVFTFCSGPHRVLASPGQRPDDRMFVPSPWGGTDPVSALSGAFHHLAASPARNRLMLMLTDGEWYGTKGDDLILAMRSLGITTALAHMEDSSAQAAWDAYLKAHPGKADERPTPSTHHVEFFESILEPSDFALLFRNVALATMHRGW